ncbi:hypothetical protein JQX13_45685 [Archangium violaceum]|uniref:hypothetical protein n=1 Tax=Archangium violaceum TaxID=83451 RepID=UPI00193BA2C7|nr:hypothetical protein [Archangium violaceum]QRK07262.1 hypothetical protein JQX13_45685 [Archangium violaceum]
MNNGKSKPGQAERTRVTALQLEQDDLVIFGEDGKFHHVPKTYYATPEQRLPDRFKSAPEFLVGLGAVVADVTAYQSAQEDETAREPLTADCACIVLNMAAIRQESEKHKDPRAGRPIPNGDPVNATSEPPEVESPPGLRVERDDLVIFGEDGKFYLVKKQYYEQQVLPEDMQSAPQLMVELGAVVADIPRLPTAGSACQLVNMASIRRGSAHAARLVKGQRTQGLEVEGQRPVERRAQTRRGSRSGGSRRRVTSIAHRGDDRNDE